MYRLQLLVVYLGNIVVGVIGKFIFVVILLLFTIFFGKYIILYIEFIEKGTFSYGNSKTLK